MHRTGFQKYTFSMKYISVMRHGIIESYQNITVWMQIIDQWDYQFELLYQVFVGKPTFAVDTSFEGFVRFTSPLLKKPWQSQQNPLTIIEVQFVLVHHKCQEAL